MAKHWSSVLPGDFAVIGDPVGHSWSPKMHLAAFVALGIEKSYQAIQVPIEEFDEALTHLAQLGFTGVNVTVPLKEVAFRWAQSIDPIAVPYASLNTLRLEDRSGTNTDVPGFLDTLMDFGIEPPGPVLLLGAGGTARAIAEALCIHGYQLRIWNRNPERAQQLAVDLTIEPEIVAEPNLRDAILVVNATSAGLSGSTIDIAWGSSSEDRLAYDLMYSAEPTPFLRDAERAGLRTTDGRHMLVAQGARSLEWWLGVDAPRDVMLAAIS